MTTQQETKINYQHLQHLNCCQSCRSQDNETNNNDASSANNLNNSTTAEKTENTKITTADKILLNAVNDISARGLYGSRSRKNQNLLDGVRQVMENVN